MKNLLLAIFLISLSLTAFAQQEKSGTNSLKNTVYIEALGNGMLGSLNYERQLLRNPYLTGRLGIGFYLESNFYLSIPVSLHYLIELRNNNFIESGIGFTWAQYGADDCLNCDGSDNTDDYRNLFFSIGYRKHFGNNWMWKANFTPLITNNHGANFEPWFGLAIGKQF
jgi:hypothetical protein